MRIHHTCGNTDSSYCIQVCTQWTHSPQLVYDAHQHEERVLADSLLKGVRTVAEAGICAVGVKEKQIQMHTEYTEIQAAANKHTHTH